MLRMEGRAAHGALAHARGGARALAAARSPCVLRAMERRFFCSRAGDLSGFVYEEVLGAESYEASYGINFLAPSFRFVRFAI